MINIQNLEFLRDRYEVVDVCGGAWTQTHGTAKTGNGYALATIEANAVGQLTSTFAYTNTLTIQGPKLDVNSAYASGTAFAYDAGSSSFSTAKYASKSFYRH